VINKGVINKSFNYSMKLFVMKIIKSQRLLQCVLSNVFEKSDNIRNRPKSDRPATATNENKALDVL